MKANILLKSGTLIIADANQEPEMGTDSHGNDTLLLKDVEIVLVSGGLFKGTEITIGMTEISATWESIN